MISRGKSDTQEEMVRKESQCVEETKCKGEFFNFLKSKKGEIRTIEKIGVFKGSTKLDGRYK